MSNQHTQSNLTPSEPDYFILGGTNTGEPWEQFWQEWQWNQALGVRHGSPIQVIVPLSGA